MIKWGIIIAVLSIFQLLGLIGRFPAEVLYFGNLLILLSALAILYRIYRKTRSAEKERLEKELEALKAKLDPNWNE